MGRKIKPHEGIQFIMDQMNLTQADLVNAGCACRSHVSEFYNGVRKPSISFIRKFLKLTNRFDDVVDWQILTDSHKF